MKKSILVLFCISLLSPILAFSRGTISSGGDNSTAFSCTTPPNVDADLRVVGFGNIFDRQIELAIYIDGHLVATDNGVLTESPENFRGEIFDIDLKDSNDPSQGQIRAKVQNPVVQLDQAVSVICQRSLVI